jgi:hypothetical protein
MIHTMVKKKFKELLCNIVENKCEICKKEYHITDLEIHRIRRGSVGGKYEHRNCQVLCSKHHRLIHSNEPK